MRNLMSFDHLKRKHYGVIYADPAWKFQTYSAAGLGRSADRHYATMTFDAICALPIADYAADDCALFLWTTWPVIFSAQRVIESWGFNYSGLAWEWLKFNPVTGKAAFGGGYGTRKNVEPCLLATRGSPKRKSASVRDWLAGDAEDFDDLIVSPRREHSRKPDEAYDRIEALFDGPYLELNARQTRSGWDAWGDEIGKFDTPVRVEDAF